MDQSEALVPDCRDLISALVETSLLAPEPVEFESLAGGVSCDVWRVEGLDGPLVVKRPLEKLRVAVDWRAPLERRSSEVNWLHLAHAVNPAMAPEVLADFPTLDAFVLRYIPGCEVWKDALTDGRVDSEFAAAVGRGIALIHAATAGKAEVQSRFPDPGLFRALRIDPFLRHVAAKHEALAEPLTAIADRLDTARIALVHGDVSPKNILVSEQGPVFLDAECAVFGDPAFDLAFCTTHLLLKAVWLDLPAMQTAASAMIAAYVEGIDWEAPADLLARAGKLTAALLLARIEGKSPAPYLIDPRHQQIVRSQAEALLFAPRPIDRLVADWKRT